MGKECAVRKERNKDEAVKQNQHKKKDTSRSTHLGERRM